MGRIVILGQGYVGLPLAMGAAHAGHQVVGYDIDHVRIKQLQAGQSYVEDITDAMLAEVLGSESYIPTDDEAQLAGFDCALITVPTPLREGVPDLSYIESAAVALAAHLRPGATVVLESTTYPGTTEDLLRKLLESGSGLTAGEDFHLGYSPERIDPGNKTWGLKETPKVMAGIDAASTSAIQGFYGGFVSTTVPVSSPKVAELAKLIENTFRHVNIALVNELAMYAHALDIDIWEAVDAASSKPFGFMRFTPGPGVGGHCLPIDPVYLSWQVQRKVGRLFRFVELANHINGHMPDYVVQRLMTGLNARRLPVNGSRVLLLGLSYKPNTGDVREAPSLRVADLLLELGAQVRAADPHVVERGPLADGVTRVDFTEDELRSADAVVLLSDHEEFDYEAVARHASYVLDCRNRLTTSETVDVL
ncbi:nucleotide sugar dehydrogenase [Streptomyces sp. N2-109]|uniref:Nucleotide sugar dehydrogenase n=1 Tax=Streptomyces gossypii TaxID=2883101 RepID=A0ABT2JPC1_9ACTN|nr:nucleotide sugar dehydrogenase [Streptomyces gossypii]MCT2589586.1 nucleotide sugar dehydrogenase [Streptomyces gossypii]